MKTNLKSIARFLAVLVLIFTLAHVQTAQATSPSEDNQLAAPPLFEGIQQISAGGGHTCALTQNGGVFCWGNNFYGQIGDGSITDHLVPTEIPGLTNGIAAISTGSNHSCALTDAGGVKCWGYNNFGQLGNGSTTDGHAPVDVVGMSSGIAAISLGRYHTCALTTAGGVKCWGFNSDGQLGDGTTTDSLAPVDVNGLTSGVLAISVGERYGCAITANRGLKCWGINASGQLGDGTKIGRLTPVDVTNMTTGVRAVSTGANHTCALTTGGAVKCWGWNKSGELGNGQNIQSLIPVDVTGMASGMKAVQVGESHTCAVSDVGAAYCWGGNKFGQLGNGTLANSNLPIAVTGLSNSVKRISADYRHTCIILSTNGVKCWGWNPYGMLGDATVIRRTTPVNVLNLAEAHFRSNANLDGFIREISEESNIGGIVNPADDFLLIGDDELDRQYVAILSFNTSPLPDSAVIYSAPLDLHWVADSGSSAGWSKIKVDIRESYFGSSISLLPEDFQASASRSGVGTFPINGNPFLSNYAFPYINLIGSTQFRIRYALTDNDNSTADFTRYASGNAGLANRPELIVYYYVP